MLSARKSDALRRARTAGTIRPNATDPRSSMLQQPARLSTRKLTGRVNEQSFTGGLRARAFNATSPLARLILTDEGMTVRVFGFVYARREWSGVASAQRVVGGFLGSPGLRLTLSDGKQFVFWCFNPQPVLEALKSRGVRILDSGDKPPK